MGFEDGVGVPRRLILETPRVLRYFGMAARHREEEILDRFEKILWVGYAFGVGQAWAKDYIWLGRAWVLSEALHDFVRLYWMMKGMAALLWL